MAHAHDLLLALELALDPRVYFVGRADLLEHVDDRLVCASVQRTFERSDRRGDGGVDVGKCGGRDAGGKGRGVEAVVGMQDVGQVERLYGLRSRGLARHEV